MKDEIDLPEDTLPAQKLAELKAAPPSMWYSRKDNSICIPVPDAKAPVTEYWIDLIRLQTPLQLLAWTAHLAAKPWMPRQRLREFIRFASKLRHFDVPHSL